jgi:hypothetical protein
MQASDGEDGEDGEERFYRRTNGLHAAARRGPRSGLREQLAHTDVENRTDRAVGCVLCWATGSRDLR